MIQVVRFEIPGDVMPKERPRLNPYTGHVYTPERTKDYEEVVQWAYRKAKGLYFPKGTAVVLEIEIYRTMPKSWTKKKRQELEGKPMDQKPDLDNLEKAIMDGLKEAWADDCQVTDKYSKKRWAKVGRAFVTIRRWVDE